MTTEHELASKFFPDDLENFLRLSSDLLAVVDAAGQLLQTNAAFEQTLGWRAADLRGKPFIDLFRPDESARQPAIEQALKTQATVRLRGYCRCSDGSWKWIEWTVGRGLIGTAPKLYCVGRNLDKQYLRTIFERAGIGIARLDLAGQWIQANDRLCEILAYSREELFQKDFRDITHPEDAGQDAELYQKLRQGELETAVMEKRYLRKSGEAVWCSVTASIIRDQQRQPLYFIAFIQDITDRKVSELTLQQKKDELAMSNLVLAQTTANLAQRNRELDEFAYVASHDLKAPLRAIANLATWLEEDLEGQLPPENKDQLDLLQGRVHRMENLIDGLLAYSRIGRSNYQLESVDLNQLVRNVVDLLGPPPGFTIAIAPDLPTLQASRPALTQIFNNLISNAIKHHDRPRGHIEIRYQHLDSGFHEFSVIDDGPGIAPAFHQKVFSIFQVLKARDKVENTGIGLAIVKKTVEAEGGTITVESSGVGGATFRFTWPQP